MTHTQTSKFMCLLGNSFRMSMNHQNSMKDQVSFVGDICQSIWRYKAVSKNMRQLGSGFPKTEIGLKNQLNDFADFAPPSVSCQELESLRSALHCLTAAGSDGPELPNDRNGRLGLSGMAIQSSVLQAHVAYDLQAYNGLQTSRFLAISSGSSQQVVIVFRKPMVVCGNRDSQQNLCLGLGTPLIRAPQPAVW